MGGSRRVPILHPVADGHGANASLKGVVPQEEMKEKKWKKPRIVLWRNSGHGGPGQASMPKRPSNPGWAFFTSESIIQQRLVCNHDAC